VQNLFDYELPTLLGDLTLLRQFLNLVYLPEFFATETAENSFRLEDDSKAAQQIKRGGEPTVGTETFFSSFGLMKLR
jgi:hypothetical protein